MMMNITKTMKIMTNMAIPGIRKMTGKNDNEWKYKEVKKEGGDKENNKTQWRR